MILSHHLHLLPLVQLVQEDHSDRELDNNNDMNAYDMAFSREILGVHFPSDSEAGRIFARQFVNELLKTKAFIQDLEEVKSEIEAVKKNAQ